MRHQITEEELRHLLANAHGIEVRLWDVDCTGIFCGIVCDSRNSDWKKLVLEAPNDH